MQMSWQMHLFRPLFALAVAIIVVEGNITSCLSQAIPASTITTISESVFKVQCRDLNTYSTGFLWGSNDTVITTWHSVAGCQNSISLYYKKMGRSYGATVISALPAADLVLLKIASPPIGLRPLQAASAEIQTGQRLFVIGYTFRRDLPEDNSLYVRQGARTLGEILPPNLRDQLVRNSPYPSPGIHIINLEGFLRPGHSGAPIVNSRGEVIGIGDGGLLEGAGAVSWAIPVGEAVKLLKEGKPLNAWPSGASRPANLFYDAEDEISGGEPIACGNGRFVLVRKRRVNSLMETADNAQFIGLLQAGSQPLGIEIGNELFDIWEDVDTGATIGIPTGLKPESEAGMCVIGGSGNRSFEVKFKVLTAKSDNPEEMQRRAMEYETAVMPSQYTGEWVPDQSGFHFETNRPDGMVRQFKAYMRIGVDRQPDKYVIEAFTIKGKIVVAASATNNSLRSFAKCLVAPELSECVGIRDRQRAWVLRVIGLELTSIAR